MMKHVIPIVVMLFASTCYGGDVPQEVRLVYPSTAANVETLDSSTPAKRAVPPTRESAEVDPVTPIGQIRSVVNSLAAIEESQQALAADVAALKKRAPEDRTKELLDAIRDNAHVDLSSVATKNDVKTIYEELANASQEREAIAEGIRATVKNGATLDEKLDALSSDATNIQESVDAIPTTAASKRSRLIDGCVVIIVVLVFLQIVCRIGATVYKTLNDRAKQREEELAARAYARAEAAFRKNNETL